MEALLQPELWAALLTLTALEIVLGISLKTLSNYTYRLAHPQIDPVFKVTMLKQGRAA